MSADDREIPLQAMPYFEYLSEEGYRPEVDEDGVVHFKVDGATHLILSDSRDPAFFHLVLGFRGTDEIPLDELLHRANAFNTVRKVVKAVVDEEDLGVTFHFEGYLFEKGREGTLIEKAIDVLRGSPKLFFKELGAEDSEGPGGGSDGGSQGGSDGGGKWERN
jgi:hypothetical protein